MVEIRTLRKDDLDEYRSIRFRAVEEEPESFGATLQEQRAISDEEVLRRITPDADSFVLGAFAPELVGIVGCYRNNGTKMRHKAIIWGMYVLPRARGKGIGRLLMEMALKMSAEMADIESVILTVVTTNVAAFELYKRLGFETYGMEPKALKQGDRYLDEYLMSFTIAAK